MGKTSCGATQIVSGTYQGGKVALLDTNWEFLNGTCEFCMMYTYT